MWISKRGYEDLLAAHKREVDILAAWVESLQMQQNAPFQPVRAQEQKPLQDPDMSLYISEDEEHLLEALSIGQIDQPTFEAEIEKLRQGGHTPTLSVAK